jgi:ferric-dicitrate binding protein FerR (iron transport regulator)
MKGGGKGGERGEGESASQGGRPLSANTPAPVSSAGAPPRWLEGTGSAAAQALRRALDEGGPSEDEQAFRKQRVWGRVQAPWFDPRSGQPVDLTMARRRGWAGSLVIGAGLAATVVIALLVVGDRTGVLRLGGPIARAPGESTAPVSAPVGQPEIVPLPSRTGALTTGPGERIRHRLARGVDAELAARTALVPGDEQAPPEVRVGRVRFSVPAQAPGRRYAVRAGIYEVVVLGTVFDVAVEEAGVSVDVQSGTVEVHDASTRQRLAVLSPRKRWSSAGGQVTELPPSAAASPVATRAPAPVRKRPARKVALADAEQARRLDQAGDIRRGGDSRRALSMYQRMADGSGPLAEIAHYEIGVIEDEDLRDPRRAVATWQRYRVRYPKGLLRTEADISVIEALARIGEEKRALDEAVGFLAKHPDSERRAEVARVAGDLARQRGDCRAAIPLYDQTLAARPAREDADDATFHRAACLLALDDGRGLPAARAYLGRFPLGRHALEAQRLVTGGAAAGKRGGAPSPAP